VSALPNLTPSDIQKLKSALPSMPEKEKRRTLELLKQYQTEKAKIRGKSSFLDFIHHVYPNYIVGPHHQRLARIFEEIAAGKKKRVIVNIAPRHGKSEMISYLAPAWFLGNYPHKKVIMASHTADLAVNFGRRVRNLVGSDPYHDIFPQVELQADSKSASRWGTNFNGEYFAIGVGGALAGRGADLFIIDDPHALPLDTEVPTPEGFRTIAQLRVGDEVYGPDGLPTRITAKSDVRKDRELYRLTTDDGEQVLCDGGHLWSYHSETALKNAHLIKTATARELAGWGKDNRPYLPRHAAVQYVHADLPIDPYILGVWLGDGTSTVGRMTAHPDDQPFMRKQFKDAGYETTDLVDPYNFGVKGLWTELKKWDLLDNKHIPVDYMLASVKQRMALVQGLMDTDGNVTVAGECSFNNCNESLVRQFRELLHSLGIKAKIRVYYDSRPNHNPVFRVNFKLADCCRMPRKRERTYTPTDKRRRSFEVEATGLRGDVQCITVDRPDGLFLVGRGYVVTHNSEQEAMQGRADVFEPAWEWFQSGPLQRLMPGGAIIIVMCMTGDTPVLMADGSELPLRDVQPGWMIASYENGRIVTKRVMNHQSSGIDQVYTVQTQSGRMFRANERHPFLVEQNGGQAWVRLRDLKPGMSLVALKGAADPHGRRLDPACAIPAKRERLTIASTLTHLMNRLGITGDGKTLPVQNAGVVLSSPRDSALSATASSTRRPSRPLHSVAHDASSPATGSRLKNIAGWLRSAVTAVMSAGDTHPVKTHALIGVGSCASTTTMLLDGYADSCATTATSRSDTARLQRSCAAQLSTFDFTLDPIVSITPSGREEVFDIQVADTENFIANGFVSHNTRWSKLDLTGQVIDHMTRNTGTDDWEVVEFPALLNDKPLWPDFWSIEELLSKRAGMDPRYWQAQYMQDPVSEEGALIKNEWWQIWENENPPQCAFIIMSLDAAQETNNRADYNALQVWGVFYNEESKSYQIILLNAIKQRLEFPDLKSLCIEEYKEWKPDSFIVEKKSNGAALYQELRRMGIPVSEFTPGKGQDKISRVNSVTDLFSSGFVWAPDRRWAQEVMDECQDFPSGRNDDQVDAMTLALMRFRQGGFVRLPSDEPEPVQLFKSKRRAGYY